MRAKFIFISVVMTMDAFFVGYAAGFNSRHVLIVDPKLPPLVQHKAQTKTAKTPGPAPPLGKPAPPKTGQESGSKTGNNSSSKSAKEKKKDSTNKSKESGKKSTTADTKHKGTPVQQKSETHEPSE